MWSDDVERILVNKITVVNSKKVSETELHLHCLCCSHVLSVHLHSVSHTPNADPLFPASLCRRGSHHCRAIFGFDLPPLLCTGPVPGSLNIDSQVQMGQASATGEVTVLLPEEYDFSACPQTQSLSLLVVVDFVAAERDRDSAVSCYARETLHMLLLSRTDLHSAPLFL